MIYRYRLIPVIAATLMLLAACQIGPAPLSQQELQDYIQANHIQPQLIEEVSHVTVILFKTPTQLGCDTVWSGRGIEAHKARAYLTGMQQRTVLETITVAGGSTFDSDTICLTINDRSIIQQAETLKIIFFDGEEMLIPIKNRNNIIIHRISKGNVNRSLIIIYDKDGVELVNRSIFK